MTTRSAGHLTEGDIARLCDAEMTDEELIATGSHLRGCPNCQDRVAQFREEAETVSAWLGSDASSVIRVERPDPPGDTSNSPRRFRLVIGALGAAGLAAGALAADPVRSWFGELMAGPPAVETPSPSPSASVPAADPPPAPSSTVGIGFRPRGDSLVVRFRERQDTGVLSIEWGDRAVVQAEVTDGGDETFVMVSEGFRVLNAPESRSGYRVSLPSSVRVLIVYVGNELAARVMAGDGTDGVTVPLGAPVNPEDT